MSTAGWVNKRNITFAIDGNEYAAEASNCRFTAAASSSDFTTFADAAAGGAREYALEGTAVQNTDIDSVWDLIWAQTGSELAVTFRPHGNSVPSISQPHYTATVQIAEPDGDLLGGDADASTTAYQTLDFKFSTTARPVKVTA